MDPETQYPVDAVTTEAMKTSKPVGMDMSLDDIVKQHRNANKKRGDGKLSKGGSLKVKAGVNKGGPGRSMSGTFGGRGSGPMYQKLYVHHPKAYKREDGMTVVHIFKINKDIVQVSREGEVLLDTGGDRGRGVRRAMNNALRKFGFRVTFSADDPEEWTVSDGVRYLQRYEDGMVIPRPNPPGPGRALALLQADPPPFAFAGFRSGFPRWSARGFGTRGMGRSWRGLC